MAKTRPTWSQIEDGTVLPADLIAGGTTPDSTKFYRGDGQWQNPIASLTNAQTGVAYTYQSTDRGKTVVHSNALAIAGTLPVASASFPDGWYMNVVNNGVWLLTITPVTSTINGATMLTLATWQGTKIVSDGVNYFANLWKSAWWSWDMTKAIYDTWNIQKDIFKYARRMALIL